jgi:hypothetical protein
MQTSAKRQRRSSSWWRVELALKGAFDRDFVVHGCMLAGAGNG